MGNTNLAPLALASQLADTTYFCVFQCLHYCFKKWHCNFCWELKSNLFLLLEQGELYSSILYNPWLKDYRVLISQVWNLPDSHYDQTPESPVGHGEEYRTFHGQAEASSQMRVDDGNGDEKPNYLSHHHWSIYQINPLVKRYRRVRLNGTEICNNSILKITTNMDIPWKFP